MDKCKFKPCLWLGYVRLWQSILRLIYNRLVANTCNSYRSSRSLYNYNRRHAGKYGIGKHYGLHCWKQRQPRYDCASDRKRPYSKRGNTLGVFYMGFHGRRFWCKWCGIYLYKQYDGDCTNTNRAGMVWACDNLIHGSGLHDRITT